MKKPTSVNEYIASYPPEIQEKLKTIRAAIQQAAPQAEEVISYGMPAYKYKGMLAYFAGHTHHIGFYAMPGPIKAFEKELSAYKTSKGTVQFPYEKKLPVRLIAQLIKFRVKENEEKEVMKKSKKK